MRLIFSTIFLISFLFSAAQDTIIFSKWSVTCKPLGIIDPFKTNLTAGLQYHVSKKFLVELQGGYIKTWICNSNIQEKNIRKTGYKINAEIKYVFYNKLFLSVQFFYHNYHKKDKEEVWRFAQSYSQKLEFDKLIVITGGHIKFGYILERPSKKFFYEFYGGIGERNEVVKIHSGLPDDAEIIDQGGLFQGGVFGADMPGNKVFPSIALGITIGYKL